MVVVQCNDELECASEREREPKEPAPRPQVVATDVMWSVVSH